MAEIVITLKTDDLYNLIPRAFSGVTPFLILETIDESDARLVLGMPTYVIVDRLQDAWKLNNYPSGRVFDTTGELKWQKAGTAFHVVYIGENFSDAEREGIVLESPDFVRRDSDTFVYLWGQRVLRTKMRNEMGFDEDEDIFIELQIPQYLKYPVVPEQEDARVQIRVREYYNRAGQLEYYRFVELVEANHESV